MENHPRITLKNLVHKIPKFTSVPPTTKYNTLCLHSIFNPLHHLIIPSLPIYLIIYISTHPLLPYVVKLNYPRAGTRTRKVLVNSPPQTALHSLGACVVQGRLPVRFSLQFMQSESGDILQRREIKPPLLYYRPTYSQSQSSVWPETIQSTTSKINFNRFLPAWPHPRSTNHRHRFVSFTGFSSLRHLLYRTAIETSSSLVSLTTSNRVK